MPTITTARPLGSATVDTTTLAVAVGCAAAAILLPAVAIIVYTNVRRYRRGRAPSNPLVDHGDSNAWSRRGGYYPAAEHDRREYIQLRDYESESEAGHEQHMAS